MDWVAARASRRPCRVRLVRVEAAPLVDRDVDEIAFEEAERRLHALAPDVEVTGGTVGGRMPEQLLDAAEEADLLVIGENPGRPLRSAITGWKPLRVAARSSVPTVVVPVGGSTADGPVVVGVDDDDSSATAPDDVTGSSTSRRLRTSARDLGPYSRPARGSTMILRRRLMSASLPEYRRSRR